MAAVRIRPAERRDLPAIVERWVELMAAHQALDPVLYATADHADGTYRAFVRRHFDKADSVVLVATDEYEAVLGYLVGGGGQRAPMFRVRRVGMIFDLVVRPDRRRAGIGRALVDAALEHFRQRGMPYAQVNFDPSNTSASTFWPKAGFETLLCEAYLPL